MTSIGSTGASPSTSQTQQAQQERAQEAAQQRRAEEQKQRAAEQRAQEQAQARSLERQRSDGSEMAGRAERPLPRPVSGADGKLVQSDAPPAPNQEMDRPFANLVQDIVGPSKKGKINEERLYAGVLYARIHDKHGPEAADKFKQAFQDAREPGQRRGAEERANEALISLVADGTLSKRQAARLHSEAFAAAQLDKNKDELNDGRGGEGDDTIARANYDKALQKAEKRLDAFESGKRSPEHRPFMGIFPEGMSAEEREKMMALFAGKDPDKVAAEKEAMMAGQADPEQAAEAAPAAPAQTRAAGASVPKGPTMNLYGDGFLWKPVSETTGKLVTLFPPEMTGQIESVVLRDANGQVIEQGDYASVANGGREHFRFAQAGGAYPPGVTVEVQLKDGSTKNYEIPKPSMRVE